MSSDMPKDQFFHCYTLTNLHLFHLYIFYNIDTQEDVEYPKQNKSNAYDYSNCLICIYRERSKQYVAIL